MSKAINTITKQVVLVMALMVSFGAGALDLSKFNDLLGSEQSGDYIPSTSWYWDPDQPGMGMSVSIQPSEFGETGYIIFAGIYTYKDDGSQAWYTIQGDYVPNADSNAWHEVKSVFGTPWGPDEAYMGQVHADLYETSDGMVLGSSQYRDYDIWIYKSVSLKWRNPHVIDVWIDGDHLQTFYRNTYHGDTVRGSANILTKNTFYLYGAAHGVDEKQVYNNLIERPKLEYIQSAMSFKAIEDVDGFFTQGNVTGFKSITEYDANKEYYISEQPVGHIEMIYDYKAPTVHQVFKEVIPHYRKDHYVVLVYDKDTYLLSGYYFKAVKDDDPRKGLIQAMGDFKFMGYLAPSDQGAMALFPAACAGCNETGNKGFRKELTRRSVWYLFTIQQDNGKALKRFPDVDQNLKPWYYWQEDWYED